MSPEPTREPEVNTLNLFFLALYWFAAGALFEIMLRSEPTTLGGFWFAVVLAGGGCLIALVRRAVAQRPPVSHADRKTEPEAPPRPRPEAR